MKIKITEWDDFNSNMDSFFSLYIGDGEEQKIKSVIFISELQ